MDGTEDCSCSIVLSWLHGPDTGKLTLASVKDLCPIRSQKQLDPRLGCFLELAKWKHGIVLPCSELITEDITCQEESPNSSPYKPWSLIKASCSYYCLSISFCLNSNVTMSDSIFYGMKCNGLFLKSFCRKQKAEDK